jgi:hypothetical protein
MTFLPATSAHIRDRHAKHTDIGQSAFDILQLMGPHDRFDQLHVSPPLVLRIYKTYCLSAPNCHELPGDLSLGTKLIVILGSGCFGCVTAV